MLIDLNNKVAIVTGAGRGIGNEIARTLAAEGAIVVVTDIRQELLDEVAEQWRQNGWNGLQLLCDVRKAEDNLAVVAAVEQAFGRIDILVNNAGVAGGAQVEVLPEETWDLNLDVNLKGTFLMCQAVIPVMKRQRSGRILNAASFAAIIPSVGGAAYAASKSGVEGFTRVLAGELGAHEITVNCYAPGMIPTAMNRFADRTDAEKSRLLDTLTLRRWGSPKDVANLICFLASDLASYITGTMIDVSGGKFATQMPWVSHREP
ncbi:MAG TPA: SDR family NAD(P)-dependent oxidoreductase [Devosia sp.]|jgi:3-oxoacyl-[acyl-carrier protein] reductase|uniref:SDR family NAD(P)-dependent oxidoreductase n=1 Tax=Devosia sp. TaxID=1871048 RepID=UPI002DDD6E13|nr:SDR family NAD(P)-dependent oxidoreductase [Devosia sp.]HEV2515443.1 SDR family NAD(P)-dependent oxidoreductase [Devosia sp.]